MPLIPSLLSLATSLAPNAPRMTAGYLVKPRGGETHPERSTIDVEVTLDATLGSLDHALSLAFLLTSW